MSVVRLNYFPGELERFVAESNRIERILRPPTQVELNATEDFLQLAEPSVDALEALVAVYAPGHKLRRNPGMSVWVGNYAAPQGGPGIEAEANRLCKVAADPDASPFRVHCSYELLHPFTDGNGRSGRALWAWMMVRRRFGGLGLGFLHRWYYQSLEAAEKV